MVTAEELIQGTKETLSNNSKIGIKATYDNVNQELVGLKQKNEKILFQKNRLTKILKNFVQAMENTHSSTNTTTIKNSFPLIVETNGKMLDLINESKNIIEKLNQKIEEMAKMIDKDTTLSIYKPKVEEQSNTICSNEEKIAKNEEFLQKIDEGMKQYQETLEKLGLVKKVIRNN